jgi:hypothetical protein
MENIRHNMDKYIAGLSKGIVILEGTLGELNPEINDA